MAVLLFRGICHILINNSTQFSGGPRCRDTVSKVVLIQPNSQLCPTFLQPLQTDSQHLRRSLLKKSNMKTDYENNLPYNWDQEVTAV